MRKKFVKKKQIYVSLVKRFSLLYKNVAAEKRNLDVAYSRLESEKKGEHIVYCEDEELCNILKKLKGLLSPYLDDNICMDKHSSDVTYYVNDCLLHLSQIYTSNLVPIALSKALNNFLERLDFTLSVWNLKIIFLTSAKNSNLKNSDVQILLSCVDKSPTIATILDL